MTLIDRDIPNKEHRMNKFGDCPVCGKKMED